MKAYWKGQLLADSEETKIIEGNHYFPPESLNREFFKDSEYHSTCPWKGEASYYSIEVEGELNRDAAWYYPKAKPLAESIEGYVAFWKGVEVTD